MTRFENVPEQQHYQDQPSWSRPVGARDMIEVAVSGITGLAVGAALMYLFDPQAGYKRRERLSEAASSAMETTGEYVQDIKDRILPTSHSWSDVAGDYRGRIGSTLESAKSAIAPYLGSRGRRGYISGLRDRAASTYRGASKSASRYMPRVQFGEQNRGISTTTAGIGAFAALALGCAAMYFLDPRNGAARRSYLMQKAGRWIRDTGDLARATGRHLANRSRGMAYEARSMMSSEQIDDRTLEQRVRAQLGHFGNVRNLDITVSDACVTLRGQASEPDIQNMAAAAGAVRGVRRVQCELSPFEVSIGSQPAQWQSPNPTAM